MEHEMEAPGAVQICTRCVMDASTPGIEFNEDGICNYCSEFLARSGGVVFEDPVSRAARLEELLCRVKNSGRKNPYDCVVGVSGGVDSSWALVKAVELGLRPLAVHMDNGWNSELAQNNIAELVNGLNVDLYTHVIEWQEYRELMNSFFAADVVDIELLYDNALAGVNFGQARKFGLKYVLAGTNESTEGMRVPPGWTWYKYDKRNIKAIARSNGSRKHATFPYFSTSDHLRSRYLFKVKWISFLDFFDYNKEAAIKELEDRFNFKRYPYKHYESIFTRFYQGYLLPEKFGIDKRRLHLSTLVVTGQMTRADALDDLSCSPYLSDRALKEDRDYFLKKMEWDEEVLEDYLARPPIAHDTYSSELPWHHLTSRGLRYLYLLRKSPSRTIEKLQRAVRQ